MIERYEIRGRMYELDLQREPGVIRGSIDGREIAVSYCRISETEILISDGERQVRVFVCRDRDGTCFVHSGGRAVRVHRVEDSQEEGPERTGSSDGRLTALMPGKVIKILVELGQEVQKGQSVLILESMKMETTQEAPFDGKVVEINAEAGQQVDAGTVVVRLESKSDPGLPEND